eukprot:scaffold165419_cov54-Attheya_sp.AAC.1
MKTDNDVCPLELKRISAFGLKCANESVSEESRSLFMELAHIEKNPSGLPSKIVKLVQRIVNQLDDHNVRLFDLESTMSFLSESPSDTVN